MNHNIQLRNTRKYRNPISENKTDYWTQIIPKIIVKLV